MIGSIIGAGLTAAGSIFGGISSSNAARAALERVERQKQKNQDWYDRRYNEDATQRADVQAVLARTEESIKKRNRSAAGTAAVMGASQETVAAEKEAGNAALADATSQIVAANEQRKDKIEDQYRQRDAELENQLAQIEQQKAQATAQAIQGVTQAGANIAALF